MFLYIVLIKFHLKILLENCKVIRSLELKRPEEKYIFFLRI